MANKLLKRVDRGETYAGYTTLEVCTCPSCGIIYAIPERLLDTARSWGERKLVWYCPNGHELGINGESDEDRAKREAEEARRQATRLQASLDQERAATRSQKARATRFKNDRDRDRRRVANGVCPCCGRTFKQLARHMRSQHPEFVAQADHEASSHG